MPWVIPPWLALVEFLVLTAKVYDKHNDNKATMLTMTGTTATATAVTLTTRMTATMATMTKVMWMAMAVALTTTTTMTSMTSTTTKKTMRQQMAIMQWQQQQWNEDNLMVMGLRVLCHPSEATINLCQQFEEESTRERGDFGGRKDRKGLRLKRLGGDHFISS
jgi:hypothetical protein